MIDNMITDINEINYGNIIPILMKLTMGILLLIIKITRTDRKIVSFI